MSFLKEIHHIRLNVYIYIYIYIYIYTCIYILCIIVYVCVWKTVFSLQVDTSHGSGPGNPY